MNILHSLSISVLSLSSIFAQAAPENPYISLQVEMREAIKRGNVFLKSKQAEEGYWDDENTTAFTALALTAIARDPSIKELPDYADKAYRWMLTQQKDDGGIYGKGLGNYNTSAAIMALLASERPEYEPQILKARRFLINLQSDFDTRGENDNKYDGGIGYGGTYSHSDMSNTYLAIEAIAHSKSIAEDSKYGKQPKLNWEAALTFLSRSQNLEETNDQPFASNDPNNKGGFVYFPNDSKAGEEKLENGRTALRSYGSMSYAGLLSLIHAELNKNDPRVIAVTQWISNNYTVDENPGLGPKGLFYYYQAMAKALNAAGIDKLATTDGKEIDWRKELTEKILEVQQADGSWINENSRWMESNPILVTAYSVLALEQIYASMPEKL